MRLFFVLFRLVLAIVCCYGCSGTAYAEKAQPGLQSSQDLQSTEQLPYCEPVQDSVSGPGLKLKQSIGLNTKRSNEEIRSQPMFVESNFLTSRSNLDLNMDGSVRIRRGDTLIRAERIDYFQPTDQAKASGKAE